MLFAHLKRILKLDRLRLRGPNGAKDEFLLAATAQNLRKLAKMLPISRIRCPPDRKHPVNTVALAMGSSLAVEERSRMPARPLRSASGFRCRPG